MPLQVQVGLDDYRRFVRHEHLRVHRARFWLSALGVPVVLAVAAAALAWAAGGWAAWWKSDAISVVVLGATAVAWPAFRWRSLEAQARRLFGRDPFGAATRTVTATPEALVVEGDGRTRRVDWRRVHAIEQSPAMLVFVQRPLLQGRRPTIVPARAVPAGDLAALGDEARRHWAAARARPGLAADGRSGLRV